VVLMIALRFDAPGEPSFPMMKSLLIHIAVCSLLFLPSTGQGNDAYRYDKKTRLIGSVHTHRVKEGESLIEIARAFRLGYNEIMDANQGLDPFVPATGATVTLPTSWVLPDARARDTIVINLSEMRLYYFVIRKGSRRVETFPIGIGSEGYATPLGRFRVMEKIVNPSWYVPRSIRREQPELPEVVPPGPDNPLGTHALRLSLRTILIHGTNRPWAIGRKASHGCIRLYPEDIPKLFRSVPVGARIAIVRQPVKVGIKNNTVYIEVHRDEVRKHFRYFDEALSILKKKGLLQRVSREKLAAALQRKQGIPVAISRGKGTGASAGKTASGPGGASTFSASVQRPFPIFSQRPQPSLWRLRSSLLHPRPALQRPRPSGLPLPPSLPLPQPARPRPVKEQQGPAPFRACSASLPAALSAT
jgi:L,D-transpeptidase ErfK/SrfK